jgi:hypothetical protein
VKVPKLRLRGELVQVYIETLQGVQRLRTFKVHIVEEAQGVCQRSSGFKSTSSRGQA